MEEEESSFLCISGRGGRRRAVCGVCSACVWRGRQAWRLLSANMCICGVAVCLWLFPNSEAVLQLCVEEEEGFLWCVLSSCVFLFFMCLFPSVAHSWPQHVPGGERGVVKKTGCWQLIACGRRNI